MVQRMRSNFNSRVGLVFASMTDCCHGHSCNCAEYLQQVSSHRICFPTSIGRAPSIMEWILAYKSVRLHSSASTRTDALHLFGQNSTILLSISTVDPAIKRLRLAITTTSAVFPALKPYVLAQHSKLVAPSYP